jgi:tRNA/rRNA methyltransferase
VHTTTRDASAPRVVLVSPKHQGNVGAVARAMANFGLADLWLVAPRCHVGREAEAMAVHGADVLAAATVVATLDEALADRTVVVATSARPRTADAHASSTPEAALARLHGHAGALVFGPEDTGLSNAALDRSDVVLTIPTAPYASLNLAQAVVLLAYLWFVGRPAAAQALGPAAPHAAVSTVPPSAQVVPHTAPRREQLEAMLTQFEALALRTGYTDERRVEGMMRHMRRVFTRAASDDEDVARLRGLWSQLAGALDRADRTEG